MDSGISWESSGLIHAHSANSSVIQKNRQVVARRMIGPDWMRQISVMRFHDVVSDYCFTKNIQQKQLKRVVHNGFPILRFTKGGITRYGYIEDDVLWVGDSDDFNKCNYEPIAVDTLVDRF